MPFFSTVKTTTPQNTPVPWSKLWWTIISWTTNRSFLKEIHQQATPILYSPMKALGIVIFSHMRSRISRPESGCAMAFTTVAISVLIVRFKSSNPATHTLIWDREHRSQTKRKPFSHSDTDYFQPFKASKCEHKLWNDFFIFSHTSQPVWP